MFTRKPHLSIWDFLSSYYPKVSLNHRKMPPGWPRQWTDSYTCCEFNEWSQGRWCLTQNRHITSRWPTLWWISSSQLDPMAVSTPKAWHCQLHSHEMLLWWQRSSMMRKSQQFGNKRFLLNQETFQGNTYHRWRDCGRAHHLAFL